MSQEGFFVFVMQARKGHMVLETLPDRRASYVDFSGLPVELEALKDLASDPLVGFKTSAARNDAGEQLRNFTSGR
jgi:hypothetical protein